MPGWLRWFPGLRTLVGYRRDWIGHDIVGGLSLASLIIPAGMAYAELAGLQPISGLYASLASLVVYAVFGPSRSIVLGPDSSTAPLVAATVIPIALADPSERLTLAGMLGILVGAMSFAVVLLRLGFVTDLLSRPVRVGYLNGIAIVIFVSQLPRLFGYSIDATDTFDRAVGFVAGLSSTNYLSLGLGLLALAIILLLRWLWPSLPGLLLAVVVTTVLTAAFDLAARGVPTIGEMPQGLPTPALPLVPLGHWGLLLGGAAGITVLTLADSAVLSRSFASRFGYDVDSNEEFAAIGAANAAAGVFQGFPVSASSTRTAVAVASGVKSQAAGLVAALVLVIMLLFAPTLLADLPQSSLAAIVIVAALSLGDIRGFARLLSWRRTEFALSIVSMLGVVLLGVLPGVFLAIGLSVLNFVRRQWRPHDAILGRAPGLQGYHDIEDVKDAVQIPGLLIYRFDAPLFFANAEVFRQRVIELVDEADPPPRRVVIAAEPIIDVDTSAVDALCQLERDLRKRGIELVFAELKHLVRERMKRYGLLDALGEEALYPTVGSAVHAYLHDYEVEWVDWEDAGNGVGEPSEGGTDER